MNNSKKSMLALILAAMLLFFAVSCQSGGEQGKNETTSQEGENSGQNESLPQGTNRKDIPDDLPETDLGGREFNILCHEMLTIEFVAEEENGDIVNDALYKRNTDVSERFNANIKMINIPGTWADKDSFMRTVRNSVQAGDAAYDLVAGVTSYIPTLVPEGIFLDINTVGHIDFEKPWWGANWINELSIGNKLYLTTGDIALSMWDCMFVFYFNKQIAQEGDLPNFYELVKTKQWTYDKFVELSKTVSRDLNGDGTYDKEDMFGFATTTGTIVNAFPAAFDMKITYKDAQNVPHPELDTGKWTEVAAKLIELHYNTQSSITFPDSTDAEFIVPMFVGNQILFYPQTLSFSRDFRAMETDFGILPFPLYDEGQADYCSAVRNAMSLIGIPVDVKNPDECGLIMEALAAESYKTVIPAYYDISLKVKQTRDDESGEMLDLIRGSLWMNFGYSYNLSTGNAGNYMRELIESKNPNFMSTYESTFEKRAAVFNKYIESVLEL